MWKAAGLEPVALEARVRLAVPPARGLGSSATAIVAGLMGANALVGEPLSKEKLLELAIDIEGHPDNVVPSLLGGLCMTAKAASQRWRVVRCEWTPSVKAVVAIPSIRLSTSEARRAMPKAIPVGDAVVNLGALTLLLQGLRTGNGDLISDGMHDRLHEPYRWRLDQRTATRSNRPPWTREPGVAPSAEQDQAFWLCARKTKAQPSAEPWSKPGKLPGSPAARRC